MNTDSNETKKGHPIERYAIGSGMPFKYNEDGSLGVFIPATSPGPGRQTGCRPPEVVHLT